LSDVASNLLAVTLGNIVGGTLLVAGVYWLAYLRGESGRPAQ
jgi:formate/nitrite transporter FocA (FNT family)